MKLEITRCSGEGQGICRGCFDDGKMRRYPISRLFRIDGLNGYYCSDCVKNLLSVLLDICYEPSEV